MSQIIDGKQRALEIRRFLKLEVAAFTKETSVVPCLAALLVENDPASQVYVRNKEKACEKVGIESRTQRLPADLSESDLLEVVQDLNADPSVHGILVQLPLPSHINPEPIIQAISPKKDVDGIHPTNLGRLMRGQDTFVACTPSGIMDLLDTLNLDLTGKHAVVIGRSLIVGMPLSMLLLERNMTVTMCHSRTQDLPAVASTADVLVAAVGRPQLVTGDFIKEGAVVIDVGVNRLPDGSLVGDVHFKQAIERASAITPVPRGVGPMTIAKLLENVFKAAKSYSLASTR
mgnify:CR=1 FL=1